MKNASRKWLVIVAVLLGTFTVILNTSLLNPAIPQFKSWFEVSDLKAGWIITVYILALGLTLPLTPYLSSRYGSKKVYLAGLAIFLRLLFLINLPTGLLGLVAGCLFIKSSAGKETGRLDKLDKTGFLLITVGVGFCLYALGRMDTAEQAMNLANGLLLAVGGACLVLFVVHGRKTEAPLLDLSLLKIPLFRMGTVVTTLIAVGYYVSFLLMPLLLQEVYKLSATVTGMLYIPDALMTGLFMIVGGKILDRRGAKYAVIFGLAVTGLTTLLLGRLDDATPLWYIAVLLALRGAGFGLSGIPATTAGMGALPEHRLVEGSTLNDLVEQLTSSLAIVVCLLAFEFNVDSSLSEFRPAEQGSLDIINAIFTVLGILNLLVLIVWWQSFHKRKAAASVK